MGTAGSPVNAILTILSRCHYAGCSRSSPTSTRLIPLKLNKSPT